MTAFLSNDISMRTAYENGKDLYAMIAQAAFDNNYEDNLEFHIPGEIVVVDGKEIVSGSGKEFQVQTDDHDSITVNYYEIITTNSGDKQANEIALSDKIISDIGDLTITNIVVADKKITFYLAK